MIQRYVSAILAGALVAVLAFTSTASAVEDEDCLSIALARGPNTIVIDGLTIEIYPQHAQGDAVYYAGWAYDFTVGRVLCVEGGLVTGKLGCYLAKAQEIVGSLDPTNLNFRYVYPNENGGYTIDGNRLAGDAMAC